MLANETERQAADCSFESGLAAPHTWLIVPRDLELRAGGPVEALYVFPVRGVVPRRGGR